VANRFWVGGTGSWSDTAHWATTSGGAGGQTVPVFSDVVTVDNHASGLNGGTLTVDQTVNVTSITAGSANGTINFGSNNVTTSASPGVSFGGSVTRNIDMGSRDLDVQWDCWVSLCCGNDHGLNPHFL